MHSENPAPQKGEEMNINNLNCTAYEIDFIGVPRDKASKDADAICFRWKSSDGSCKTGVYDAGFQAHGEAMVGHINEYYFNDEYGLLGRNEKHIDYVFVSHPHNDHSSGIPEILNNFSVGAIYMNRPWLYTSELMEMADTDGRTTEHSLKVELREDFPYVNEIEKLADTLGIEIREAFAGTAIEGGILRILSPGRERYLSKIVESRKTKRISAMTDSCALAEQAKSGGFYVCETWDEETLGDDHAGTDAENETSIILYGFKNTGGMLLVGDAGTESLQEAGIQAANNNIILEDDVKFTEIPHHGGRHNVTTSVMDMLFGCPGREDGERNKTAYVSVAEGSDHPRRVVVNAFIRRGFQVYKTKDGVRCYQCGGMPERKDFSISTDHILFSNKVEEW